MSRAEFDELTPAETRALRRATDVLIEEEVEVWVALTKGVMAAASGGRFRG